MGQVVIAVVDPRRLIREGVASLLSARDDVLVAACVAQQDDVTLPVDVLVLGGGAERTSRLASHDVVSYDDEHDERTILADIDAILAASASPGPVRPERSRSNRSPLTPRETEVLQLVGTGRSAQEIAAHLGLSTHSVQSYKRAVLAKLGAQNQAEALSRAIELRLVDASHR